LTDNLISATAGQVGRKKVNYEQTPLRLPEGTLAKVEAALEDGEKRADFLRLAVETELVRRERQAKRKEHS